MLHPSYTELMKIINQDSEDDTPVINSRYSIVMAIRMTLRTIYIIIVPVLNSRTGCSSCILS